MNDTSSTEEKPIAPLSSTKCANEVQEELEQWFAMRATYRSEKMMKDELEAIGLKCFYATEKVEKRVGRRLKKVWAPVVANMIFVFGKKSEIQAFKKTKERLQYQCKPDGAGGRTPIIVPNDQMDAFIQLYKNCQYEITEDPDILNNIKPGQRVKVVEGPFTGYTGTFQHIKGHRSKVFIVSIEGLMAIYTTEIKPENLEKIED